MVSGFGTRLRPTLLGLVGAACLVIGTAAVPASAATLTSGGRTSHAHHQCGHHTRATGNAGATKATGPTGASGSTGSTAVGKGSGSSTGTNSSSGGTFAQGAAYAAPSGGLQVGSKIDGLTVTKVIHLTATAYGATAQDNYPYGAVDAFGVPLKPGDVAVDPSVIALNTKLYVTGYNSPNLPRGGELAVARDTGGAIKGDRIDMYINSTNEALINAFGIQHVTAYVLSGSATTTTTSTSGATNHGSSATQGHSRTTRIDASATNGNSGGTRGSGSRAGSSSGSGSASTGAGSGKTTSSGSGSTTSGTTKSFVQGTASPTVNGGLQVGGKIDGLTIVRVIHLTATAYGATAQDNYPYGPTDAFGVPLKPGDVAVDPSVIALNTKMYVTGYKTPNLPQGGELAVARDTGGAIKGNRIDMYINSTNESLINSFGIQQVTAYILK